MGGWTLVGFIAFAFGPSSALLFNVVAQRSQLVILMVTSAFFCLLALMVTGFLWWAIDGLKTLPLLTVSLGALFIECARYAFLHAYEQGDGKVKALTGGENTSPFSDFSSAIASGLGFGFVYTLIMYGGMLQASLQPGDLFTDACPGISAFVLSAVLALMYQAFHILWMVLMLDAFRRGEWKAKWIRVAMVLALHLAASLVSVMNDQDSIGCKVGVPLQSAVLLVSAAETIRVVRSKDYAVVHHRIG